MHEMREPSASSSTSTITRLEIAHAPVLSGIAIELTNACNLKCLKCWSQSPVLRAARSKGFMTDKLFYKVLAETVEIFQVGDRCDRCIAALSYGGESTLHPHWKEYAEAFGKTPIKRRQIVSNFVLMDTPERRQVILDNFAEVAVSIHNVPELPEVLQNVRDFKTQLHDSGVKLYFRANIVEEEFRTKYSMIKVLRELERIPVEIKLISAITEDLSRYVNDLTSRQTMCFSPFWYMGILWNGDVLPCCHILSTGGWTLGNVTDRTMQAVFDDQPYRNLRAAFYEGSPCERCTIRS